MNRIQGIGIIAGYGQHKQLDMKLANQHSNDIRTRGGPHKIMYATVFNESSIDFCDEF